MKNIINYKIENLVIAAISITVITQMPILLEYNKQFKLILLIIWASLLVINFSKFGITTKKNLIMKLFIVILFNTTIFILSIFDVRYLKSIHFSAINMAFLFYLVGYTTVNKNYNYLIKNITKGLLILVFIITIDIYFSYLHNVNIMGSKQYLYASKNSIGMLIVLTIVLIDNYMFKERYKNIINLVKLWFIIVLFLLQNRTGLLILGMYYSSIVILMRPKITSKYLIIVVVLILFSIIYKDKIFEFINWSLRLEISDNLNELSSGRLGLIERAIKSFFENPWLGIPTYYIDNIYVCLLAEYGLIGFFIVTTFITLMIFDAIKYFIRKEYTIFYLICIPIIAGLFEAMPPFSPGGIYCTFWFIYGLFERNYNYEYK